VTDLIVVACHGLETDWHRQSLATLEPYLTPDRPAAFVDTSAGGHPTGAYISVYRHSDADRFLFIQDSMTALDDPLQWFRDQWPGSGAVAWQRFPMQWDNDGQRLAVEQSYPDTHPSHGIFGPVFYTDRASLDLLAAKDLLPSIPQNRMEAQGSERAWAYAYAAAGLPVVGPEWEPDALVADRPVGPFRKVFAGRP
jgi:hypothetical protein